jgi:serine protease Do
MFNPLKSPTPRRGRVALTAILLASTALGGFAAGHSVWAADQPPAVNTTPAVQSAPLASMPDFADLVSRVKPAVVSITTMLKPQQASDDGATMSPFGMMNPHGDMGGRARAVEAKGSGFIINAGGTVVTNNHVVRDAKSVSVTLADGTTLPAKVIGTDPRTDLAVLKIDAGHPLPYIQMGNSSDIRPGQWVVAMGNPFGLGGSVTAGIISASGRDIGEGPYDNFIQVDAPINQGNSGGPLFTQDGKVVGVNTAILSPTGGSVGIGFAIPSNTVRNVVAQLETSGHVTRGYLGVEAQAIDAGMSAALHLPKTTGADHGALVASIQPDSPAAKAGIQPGDVILKVDGQAVADPRDLAVDIAGVKPGSDTHLDIFRNGQTQDVAATVASMPSQQTASNNQGNSGNADRQPQIGLALAPISPDMRSQLDLPASTKGAVVAQVQPGSPADQAGIQQGDVVVGVGNHAVTSPKEAVEAIHGATRDGQEVALRIMRDGHTQFVALDLSHPTQQAPSADDDSQG